MEQNILVELQNMGLEFVNGENVLNNRKYPKISAFDIISGPLGEELLTKTTNMEATQFIWDIINKLDEVFKGHPQYNHIGPKTRSKMVREMARLNTIQILNYISNSGLKGAGVGKIA